MTRCPTHLKHLKGDQENRRAHNARNINMVIDSLRAVGAARSIVIDEGNVILAGNGVVEAAAEAGITKVRVIEADGREIIAVRRSGLTAEQKRSLAIADNRSVELATWKIPQLQADLAAGHDLGPFFLADELNTLFQGVESSKASDHPATIWAESYQVLVTCGDEAAQASLLERLTAEGMTCRALIS